MGLKQTHMQHFHAWIRFKHLEQVSTRAPPKHPQHNPSRYVTQIYGAKTQYATRDETSALTAQQCLTIQKSQDPFCTMPDQLTLPF
jgi:hypothetical protein